MIKPASVAAPLVVRLDLARVNIENLGNTAGIDDNNAPTPWLQLFVFEHCNVIEFGEYIPFGKLDWITTNQ